MKHIMVGVILFFAVMFNFFAEEVFTQEQKNSLDMLNYLTFTTMDIIESSNSKLKLEEYRLYLLNNLHNEMIDEDTKEYIKTLAQKIEDFGLNEDKRNQIEYLHDNAQAQLIRQVFPNPMTLISGVVMGSGLPANLLGTGTSLAGGVPGVVIAVGMMALDSFNNYKTAENQTELQYLQSGWDLDKTQKQDIGFTLRLMYEHKTSISKLNGLDDYPLDEIKVKNYVGYLNEYDTKTGKLNYASQLGHLTNSENIELYKKYAPYWLDLCRIYYNLGQEAELELSELKNIKENSEQIEQLELEIKTFYQGCLDSFQEYEKNKLQIHVRDTYYAKHIPLAIYSASKILDKKNFIEFEIKIVDALVKNSYPDDWYSRYFAGLTYISLSAECSDPESFLKKAYEIIKENVNVLKEEQKKMIEYWDKPIPNLKKGASSEEKKEHDYLVSLRSASKPMFYEPFMLNSKLYFELMDNLKISISDRRLAIKTLSSVSMFFDFNDINQFKILNENNIIVKRTVPLEEKKKSYTLIVVILSIIQLIVSAVISFLKIGNPVAAILTSGVSLLIPFIFFLIFHSLISYLLPMGIFFGLFIVFAFLPS